MKDKMNCLKDLSDKELEEFFGWKIEDKWKDKNERLYYLSYLRIHPKIRVETYDGITLELVGKIMDWLTKHPKGYIELITLKPITEEELNKPMKMGFTENDGSLPNSWGEYYRDEDYQSIMWDDWEDYNPNVNGVIE